MSVEPPSDIKPRRDIKEDISGNSLAIYRFRSSVIARSHDRLISGGYLTTVNRIVDSCALYLPGRVIRRRIPLRRIRRRDDRPTNMSRAPLVTWLHTSSHRTAGRDDDACVRMYRVARGTIASSNVTRRRRSRMRDRVW